MIVVMPMLVRHFLSHGKFCRSRAADAAVNPGRAATEREKAKMEMAIPA